MTTRKLLASTALTGGMTLISRISGLVRDMIFAGLSGAGASGAADAFYVAFRIPNFLRRIFGEGALSQAFIPVFAEYRARNSADDTRLFVDHITGKLAAVLFVVTLIGVIAAPILVVLLAPGFYAEPSKYDLTVTMLRIMFPYLLFVSLVALAAGVLNTVGRFGSAAFTPVLLNLCMIAAALWIAPHLERPVLGLAWGVFIAGVAQLAFQVPFLSRVGMLPRPRLRGLHEGVKRVGRLMLPGIFGVSVAQVNLLVNTLLASFLVTGSVSWLYYADRLMEFPLGIFGIALATVILPSLSQQHAAASPEDFSHLLDWGLRWVLIISIPASAALVVLSGPMMATLFHFGKFDAVDVQMSAQALMAFSLGLVAFTVIRVLAPGFYARQDTKTPVKVGTIALIANIGFSVLLVFPLAHIGLALAISIAAFVNAALLYIRLRRDGVYQALPGWRTFLARVVFATVVMAGSISWGTDGIETWLSAPPLVRALRLAAWIVTGIIVYGAVLFLIGMRPRHLRLKAHLSTG
ncbi:MAG: murein biosynthesis integral membrane protein MurJ [Sulfurifustis sp.]